MIKKLFAALLLAVAVNYTVKAQKLNVAKLDTFFSVLNKNDKNMGSLTLSHAGTIIYQKAIGYSQLNGMVKSSANIKTKYRIGSITKMFTAVMIFQLIEEGKLKLSSHLYEFFPLLPYSDIISIGEMMDHHSGLHNFTDDSVYLTYKGKPHNSSEMMAIFERQPIDFEPNSKAAYSNTNFVLLGYIIEKITGKTYAEALKERITSKIGLTDTYFGEKTDPANNEAYSYSFDGHWKQEPETDTSVPGGAGAIVSTPTDLVRFIEALFAGKLINENDLAQMKAMRDNFGMGMFTIPFYEKTGFGHNGGIDGFSSVLVYFPEDKLAASYISNGEVFSDNDIMIAALSQYFNKPFTIPDFKTIALKKEDLDKYLGNYSSTDIPLKITITKNNATLMGQATGQQPFALEAADINKFIFRPAGITMQFDPGKSQFTLLQGGNTYLFTKEN